MKSNKQWHLITIDDPEFLPGKIFIEIIQLLIKVIKFHYVVLHDVNGCGTYGLIQRIQQRENESIDLSECLEILKEVEHLEWADFFLFKEFPKNWKLSHDYFYPEMIIQTDTTVRAVDDQYVYIYTPYQEIVDAIKQKYTIESLTTDLLENLPYPS